MATHGWMGECGHVYMPVSCTRSHHIKHHKVGECLPYIVTTKLPRRQSAHMDKPGQPGRSTGVTLLLLLLLWPVAAAAFLSCSEPRAATDVEAVLAAYAAAISGEPPASNTTKGPQEDAAAGVTAPAQPTTTANSAGTAAAAALAGAAGAGTSSQSKGSSRGALMLCVVGAKLSEGINFGDGLGR